MIEASDYLRVIANPRVQVRETVVLKKALLNSMLNSFDESLW
jgi:hypothetical protein